MKSRLAFLTAFLGVIAFVGAGPGAGAPPRPSARLLRDTRRDDTGRLLEHRGPLRDRPGRPRRHLRAGELRQQVPGRGGRVMGIVHVAIYDAAVAIKGGYQPYAVTLTVSRKASCARSPGGRLGRLASRRGGVEALRQGQRARTTARPRVRSRLVVDAPRQASGSRVLEPGGGESRRDRGVRHARRPAADAPPGCQRQAILDADYTAYLAAIPDGDGERQRDRDRRQVAAGRAREARERRPGAATHAPRPRPARPRAPASGNPHARRRCSASACPGSGRSRCGAPRSSGPTAPTH